MFRLLMVSISVCFILAGSSLSHTYDKPHKHGFGEWEGENGEKGGYFILQEDLDDGDSNINFIEGPTQTPTETQPTTQPTTAPANTGDTTPTTETTTTTAVEERRTSTGTSVPQPIGIAPPTRLIHKTAPDPRRVYETEFMLVDLGGGEPQWIELFNANSQEIDLTGWKFEYRVAMGHLGNLRTHHITLADLKIPGRSVIILTTHETTITSLDAEKIHVLRNPQGKSIGYVLKSGWRLTVPGTNGGEDIIISEQPRDEFNNGRFGDGKIQKTFHGKVNWSEQTRTSSEYRPSAEVEQGYYGHENDIGTPGFYEPPPPAAPTLQKPKRITMWANLKRK